MASEVAPVTLQESWLDAPASMDAGWAANEATTGRALAAPPAPWLPPQEDAAIATAARQSAIDP